MPAVHTNAPQEIHFRFAVRQAAAVPPKPRYPDQREQAPHAGHQNRDSPFKLRHLGRKTSAVEINDICPDSFPWWTAFPTRNRRSWDLELLNQRLAPLSKKETSRRTTV